MPTKNTEIIKDTMVGVMLDDDFTNDCDSDFAFILPRAKDLQSNLLRFYWKVLALLLLLAYYYRSHISQRIHGE